MQRVGVYLVVNLTHGASHIIADSITALTMVIIMKIVVLKLEYVVMLRHISIQAPSPVQ
jgi:hypothetical protein